MFALRLCTLCLFLHAGLARADDAPKVEPPTSSFVHVPTGQRERVQFTLDPKTDRPNLTLYMQREVNPVLGPGGSAETGFYRPLCALPCELDMRPGPYVLGVAAGAGHTVKLDETLSLRGGEQLALGYDDRKLVRIGGWIILLGGSAAGAVTLMHGLGQERTGEIVAGAVLGAVAIGVGLWLANLPDRGYVRRLR